MCVLPENETVTTQNETKGLPIAFFVGFFFWRPTFLMWRVAKDSSDECESAATDVHTQFLGLNWSLLKNCVWTISR